MTKPQIWIDCDGVLADFITAYLALVKQHTGRTHTRDEITSFDLSECIVSAEEDAFIWRSLIDQPGWVLGLQPLPGALWAVNALRALGRVGVLTSPHLGPHWVHERARWLMAGDSFAFKRREIVWASDKSHVRGDVLIDDNKDHCVAWAKRNPNGAAILLDSPWNQGTAHFVHRACDLNHAVMIAACRFPPGRSILPGSEAGETP